MKKCLKCGTENQDWLENCKKCGRWIEKIEEEVKNNKEEITIPRLILFIALVTLSFCGIMGLVLGFGWLYQYYNSDNGQQIQTLAFENIQENNTQSKELPGLSGQNQREDSGQATNISENKENENKNNSIEKYIVASRYYPLTKGLAWKYFDSTGGIRYYEKIPYDLTEIQGERQCRLFYINSCINQYGNDWINVSEGEKRIIMNTNGDIVETQDHIYASIMPGLSGKNVYSEPHILIKNKTKIGDSWKYTNSGDHVTRKIAGFKNININGQTYYDCLQIDCTITISSGEYSEHIFYAPDVGLVKDVSISKNGEETVIKELDTFLKSE